MILSNCFCAPEIELDVSDPDPAALRFIWKTKMPLLPEAWRLRRLLRAFGMTRLVAIFALDTLIVVPSLRPMVQVIIDFDATTATDVSQVIRDPRSRISKLHF